MLNNIKPTWIFLGGVLITMLWALEFDNRPRTRLIIPGLVRPCLIHQLLS